MKPVRKSAKQIRSEILEAAKAAERDARAFNKLLVNPDPRVKRNERTIYMGLVWQFVAEYRRKMILLKGAAAVRDVRKLHTELVREQQQLQKLGSDGAEVLRQFNLRWAAVIDDSCDAI
jgi:predicted nuclease of restriction endonuclease-like RecB superfamily